MANERDAFLREIEEEVRKERLAKLWDKYGVLAIGVAAAIILYEAQRQRANAGMYNQSRLGSVEKETVLFEWCYPEIAARCRSRGLPYPGLSDDGQMTSNPLAANAWSRNTHDGKRERGPRASKRFSGSAA